MDPKTLIAAARLAACRSWPLLSTPIMSLTPIIKEGIGTAGVDARMRLYVDPDFFLSKDDVFQKFLVMHEVLHPVLGHHRRGKLLLGNDPDPQTAYLWNVGADISLHCIMQRNGIDVPSEAMTHDKFGFKSGLTAEEYFSLLIKMPQPPPMQLEINGFKGGSCSDGQKREWEDSLDDKPIGEKPDADADGKPSGLGEFEINQLQKEVAAEAKNAGNGHSELSRCADHLLTPKARPEDLLRGIISRSLGTAVLGNQYASYQRPSRRPSLTGLCRPSMWKNQPNITMIMDTSGSMNSNDLGLAMGMIDRVLKTIQCSGGLRVITGDVQAANEQRVFHPKQINALGGGGTDMGAIVQDTIANSTGNNMPDIIIVLTDGYTPWHDTPTQIPVVAALTRDMEDSVPPHVKAVYIK